MTSREARAESPSREARVESRVNFGVNTLNICELTVYEFSVIHELSVNS